MVPGDGNCLFRAVSEGIKEDHEILRKLSMEYLVENKQEFSWCFESSDDM
jgi:hypothetical protein